AAACPPRWTRRRALRYFGGGLAATLAAGLCSRRLWPDDRLADPIRLLAINGVVTLRTAAGDLMPPGGFVPPGGTVSTHGPGSSVILRYRDGTAIALAGDSEVTVSDNGRRVFLNLGTATAEIAPQPADATPLTFQTTEAT